MVSAVDPGAEIGVGPGCSDGVAAEVDHETVAVDPAAESGAEFDVFVAEVAGEGGEVFSFDAAIIDGSGEVAKLAEIESTESVAETGDLEAEIVGGQTIDCGVEASAVEPVVRYGETGVAHAGRSAGAECPVGIGEGGC